MLRLQSDTDSISLVELFVQDIAERFDIEESKFPNILISLTEAVNNAIVHGNKEDNEKIVSIYVRENVKGITLRVSDQGSGFNPNSVPNPTEEEFLHEEGGRGVFLIRELSDRCNYLDEGRTIEMYFAV